MKKYVVFSISFIFLFLLLQFLFGIFQTLVYTPNMNEAWSMGADLTQETRIISSHNSLLITFIIAFLSASIAYVIPNRLIKTDKR